MAHQTADILKSPQSGQTRGQQPRIAQKLT